ncbi:MAG TPA: glycerophosphodiester phosphodiesterase [Candidatus Dormibacteraeota bacterium]|nr:glycerophosphodiester phosphodiesterase [Candidatus Dormibacteraeota bacterium]
MAGQVIPSLLDTDRRPLVIAHRGASRAAPENSLEAFEAAIEIGCDAVEMDVRRTADGVLVLHHAAARRGTPLGRLTYAQLARRSRHAPARLVDAVTLCAGRIGMDVEIKEAGLEAEVLGVLAQRFAPSALLITSFHESVIATVKRSQPRVRCGLLVGPGRGRRASGAGPLEWVARCGADVLLPHRLLTPARRLRRGPPHDALIDAAHRAGVPVILWTVNSSRHMERFLGDQRVAGIITDLPDQARALRRRLRPSGAQPPT